MSDGLPFQFEILMRFCSLRFAESVYASGAVS